MKTRVNFLVLSFLLVISTSFGVEAKRLEVTPSDDYFLKVEELIDISEVLCSSLSNDENLPFIGNWRVVDFDAVDSDAQKQASAFLALALIFKDQEGLIVDITEERISLFGSKGNEELASFDFQYEQNENGAYRLFNPQNKEEEVTIVKKGEHFTLQIKNATLYLK